MEKRTIGNFIAALRRAKGMTQQELADVLNVSNKTVSRWERDECAPDISLIPIIAEYFGVSCDELITGKKWSGDPEGEDVGEKRRKKAEAMLISRAVSRFKLLILIARSLSTIGYLFMIGISYGLLRPIIGFIVMLIFFVVSMVMTQVASARLRVMSCAVFEETKLVQKL